jgi:two-component system OmpR family response regulator
MKRVLVVDDDPHLRDVVTYTLEREGFQVVAAADGKEALLAAAPPARFDLVVLDVLMPELDGLEVCRRLRATSRTPVVFLSSRDEELDKVVGLELGGDDYVTKPFSPRELAARVRAVLRRAEAPIQVPSSSQVQKTLLSHGPIRLDVERHEVTWNEQPVHLTVTEFGLLACLLERPGAVLSRAQLVDKAYAYDNLITERTIDTHVKRVRKKFRDVGNDPVETVYGVGYKLRA